MGRRQIGGKHLLELPNLMLVYKALKRGLRDDGIERVMHPESSKYAYKGA
jgi:RNA-directed DNA polymerase